MDHLFGRDALTSQAKQSVKDRNGVLLVGAAGVGKSAVSTHLAELLAHDGWHVEPIRCSEMSTALAFAPLMHMFPEVALPDASQLGRALIDILIERAGEKQLVLIVDDVQHSDPGTASVIFGLLVHHDARVIASTRPADINAPAVQTLWKDGHLHRIDVEPIESDAVAQIAEFMTGAPPDPTLLSQLIQRAAGNPFFTIALTRAGITSGAIQDRDGGSSLVRTLPESAEISDLLRSQLSALTDEQLSLLETIAVGENMALEVFGDTDAQRLVERMVAMGLVSIDRTNPSHTTRCAHPLIGEYLRRQIPIGRFTAIHQHLVSCVDELETAAPIDRLRATSFALEADADISPSALVEGARVALNILDLNLAETAARRACKVEPSAESHLILAAALALAGTVPEAKTHFARVRELEPSEKQLAELAIAEANMAVFFEFDIASAEKILTDAFTSLSSTAARARVGATMIFPLVMSNRYPEAVALGTELADYPDIDPETELNVLGMLCMAKFITGSFDDLDRYVGRGEQLTEAGGAQSSMSQIQIKLSRAQLDMAMCRFDQACTRIQNASDLYVLSRGAGGRTTVWSLTLAAIQSVTGELDDAVAHTTIAVQKSTEHDFLGMHAMMTMCAAAIQAQTGETKQAQVLVDSLAPEKITFDTRAQIWKGWADAWIIGIVDPEQGAKIAAEVGAIGCERNMNVWAWNVLHAAVRLGHAELVVDQLEREAAESSVALIDLFARHARAATDNDAVQLESVANEYRAMQAWAAAAEVSVLAARVHEANNDSLAANVAHTRAAQAASHCTGCRTPLLAAIASPLSDHEAAVAQLAADGATSKEIAEARFVSARTVDNQLRSVYKKLGLTGRAELKTIF